MFQDLRRAQNVLGRDLLTLAPELVAAVPTTGTLQDAGTDQLLQDRLKMARWQRVARRKLLPRDPTPIAMDGDVQGSSNSPLCDTSDMGVTRPQPRG